MAKIFMRGQVTGGTRPRLVDAFASNLARARRRAELTQEQLAARTGYSLGTVTQLERAVRAPSLETVERMAGALGLADEPWRLLVLSRPN